MKHKPLLIVMMFLVLVLIGLISTGGYLVYKNGLLTQNTQTDTTLTTQAVNEYGIPYSELHNASIDDIVLNITNARGRIKLMKFSFTMKSTQENIEEIVDSNKDEIIDIVIGQVGQRTSEELLTIGGKKLLKEELLAEFNGVLNDLAKGNDEIKINNIKEILFTTFVMK